MSNKDFLARFGSKEHVDELMNHGDPDNDDHEITHQITHNPHSSSEHIDKILDKNNWYHREISKRDDLKPQHLDKLIDIGDHWINSDISKSKNTLLPHHIDKILDYSTHKVPSAWTRINIARRTDLTSEHLDRLVKDDMQDVKMTASLHPNLERRHHEVLAKDPHWAISSVSKDKLKELDK